MSEWFDNRKKTTNFRKLVRGRVEEANPRLQLIAEEAKHLAKLKAIAETLKRGKNLQNRQLQMWLSHESASRLGL